MRTASGVVLLGILVASLFLGQPFFAGFVAAVVAVGLYEYHQLWRGQGLSPEPLLLGPLAAFWLFRYGYPHFAGAPAALVLVALAGLVVALRWPAGCHPFQRWALAVGGALWLGYCPGFLLLLYQRAGSGTRAAALLLLTVGVAVVGDTLAFLVGSRFGRHKLAPAISPSKTWEGAVAALVFPTVLIGLLLPLALPAVSIGLAFLIGVAASVAAVLGDLAESALKREVGVKDSGRLLPGHGGVLDRVDGLIFVGAVVYSILGFAHAF
ncbi:MAG: phosphatidate cytidylyltransferase [Candidatus Dormibacteria bacterium]